MCGEVVALDLKLTNCGHLPLHNVRVASTQPTVFTFGTGHSHLPNNTSEKKPFGAYQTMDTCSDTDVDGGDTDTSTTTTTTDSAIDFVLRVKLLGGLLEPGHCCRVPMWIRAPSHPASHSIDFLFYYESTSSNPKMRSAFACNELQRLCHL